MTTFLLITACMIPAYLAAASLLGHWLRRIRMSYPAASVGPTATRSSMTYAHAATALPAGRMSGKPSNLSKSLTPEPGICRPVPRECTA